MDYMRWQIEEVCHGEGSESGISRGQPERGY